MENLEQLSTHIASVWKCDASRYPELAYLSEEGQRNFRIKHSILHITKSLGKLAALCEDFDHEDADKEGSKEERKKLAIKLFINALKLAEESDVSAKELLEKSPEYIA